MTEFYKDKYAIVYNSDFRNIIDTVTFDYIITDPPYNVNYDYPDYKDNLSSEQYIQLLSPLHLHKTIMIHYAEAFCGDVGSGSLYFACKNTGRKCIGIEQSNKHLLFFKERLEKQ